MKEILVRELSFILTLFILRHPCTSLVYYFFVCFYLTKQTLCSLLQPWSGYAWPKKLLLSRAPVMVQFMQNEPHTNRHKPPFLLLCWICSIHRSASSCLLRPSVIIIINISNKVWSIFGSIFRINDRICTWVKRM